MHTSTNLRHRVVWAGANFLPLPRHARRTCCARLGRLSVKPTMRRRPGTRRRRYGITARCFSCCRKLSSIPRFFIAFGPSSSVSSHKPPNRPIFRTNATAWKNSRARSVPRHSRRGPRATRGGSGAKAIRSPNSPSGSRRRADACARPAGPAGPARARARPAARARASVPPRRRASRPARLHGVPSPRRRRPASPSPIRGPARPPALGQRAIPSRRRPNGRRHLGTEARRRGGPRWRTTPRRSRWSAQRGHGCRAARSAGLVRWHAFAPRTWSRSILARSGRGCCGIWC